MSSSKKTPDVYVPVFKGPLEGWTVNYMSKNMWRVEATQEWEDVMQEAQCVFLKLKSRYADTGQVSDPPHFMALYKTAFTRRFTDLSNDNTNRRHEVVTAYSNQDGNGGHYDHVLEHMGETDNEGNLATLLRQAPAEVVQVLNLFLNCPQEILELALGSWRQNGSKLICRLLGISEDRNIMRETLEYFDKS